MEIFEISKYQNTKCIQYINKYCEGRYSFSDALKRRGIGFGGLRYIKGIAQLDKNSDGSHLGNIELLKKGLAIYINNSTINYAVIIQEKEVKHIQIVKKEDKIAFSSKSITKRLMAWKIPYHISKLLLFDEEIVELHTAYLKINLGNNTLVFSMKNKAINRSVSLFLNSTYANNLSMDIEYFKVIS